MISERNIYCITVGIRYVGVTVDRKRSDMSARGNFVYCDLAVYSVAYYKIISAYGRLSVKRNREQLGDGIFEKNYCKKTYR